MRRIVTFNHVTADGYFAGTDGSLGWVVQEPELDTGIAAGITGDGTLLFGRRTYDMFESFWPHAVADKPDARSARDPHSGRAPLSPAQRAMGTWINKATKIVFSRTRSDVTWNNSTLRRELDPREIERLKSEPGADIMIFGSSSIVSRLTEHGLIDEYQFVVSPVFLGSGRSLIDGVSTSRRLELVDAKPYPTGCVKLTYTPTPSEA